MDVSAIVKPRAELRGISQSLGCSAPIFCQGRRLPRMSGVAIPGWHQPVSSHLPAPALRLPRHSLPASCLPAGTDFSSASTGSRSPNRNPRTPTFPCRAILSSVLPFAPGAFADVFLNAGVFALGCGATTSSAGARHSGYTRGCCSVRHHHYHRVDRP